MKKAQILVVGSVLPSLVDQFAISGWLFKPTREILFLSTDDSGEPLIFGYSQSDLESISEEYGHGSRLDGPHAINKIENISQ